MRKFSPRGRNRLTDCGSLCIICLSVKSIVIELKDKATYSGTTVLAEGDFESIGCPTLDYECVVVREKEEYRLQMRYKISMDLSCARCLRPAAYADEREIAALCRHRVSEEDDDGEEYMLPIVRGKADILKPMVQDIDLNLPIAYLCSDACEGICPICGSCRSCGCETGGTNPFRALKDYFSNSKEE